MPPQFGIAVGFVGAPLETVAAELVQWHDEIGFAPGRTDLRGGLVENAAALLPLADAPYVRSLVVATRSPAWTAFLDARVDGGDPRSAVAVLGRRIGASTLSVRAAPFRGDSDAIPGCPGALVWEYSPDGTRATQRSVALVEGEASTRLTFEAFGPTQAWERTDAYEASNARARITAELVSDYCEEVGVTPFDTDFYAGPAVLVARHD